MKIRYAELRAPREFVIKEGELETESHEVMLEIAACGLCHWEIENHYLGKLGTFPQTLGHEIAGVLTQVGKDVQGWKVGDRVTGLLPGMFSVPMILKGFATHAAADPQWLVRVPDHVELEHALAEPLKCATTIARAANPQFGDYVLALGCGFMGSLVVAALKGNTPAELIAVDLLPERLELAKELGATIVLNPTECDLEKEIEKITNGHGIDVAVEISGSAETLTTAARVLRQRRGKLVMGGYHGSASYNLDSWCRHGIEVHVPHPNYSLDEKEDMKRSITALAREIFPMDKLITHRFDLDHIQEGFEAAPSHSPEFIKGIVLP